MSEQYVASFEKAVLPLIEWVKANEWAPEFQDYCGVFFQEIAEAYGGSVFDVLAELPTPLWDKAIECAFCDFMTAVREGKPRNALDNYLEEMGQGLEGPDVDFLIALRHSFVSMYSVVERTPGEKVVLRDLIGGFGSLEIKDEFATSTLAPGDNVAARIIKFDGKHYLAGPVLPYAKEMLAGIIGIFESAFKAEMRSVAKYLQKDVRQKNLVRQRILQGAASSLTEGWVTEVLGALEDAPPLANEDDPETMFHAKIPYTAKREGLLKWLDAQPDIDRALAKEYMWFWYRDRADGDASIKALLWMTETDLHLESCERDRISAAVGVLVMDLGDGAGEPLIWEVESESGGLASFDDEDDDDDMPEWMLSEPPTEEGLSAIRDPIRRFIDEKFRALLDESIPDLDGKVPRELAKTVKGRKQVRKWLESLEENLRDDPALSLIEYDTSWMWKELGIENERQSKLFE